jgi:hypothetical protein
MTPVRIAHAEPRPGNLGNGTFITHGYLVVLADDEGHRAMPVWFRGEPGGDSLATLMGRDGGDIAPAGAPEELIARLLRASGASVTGVDIDVTEPGAAELRPEPAGFAAALADPSTHVGIVPAGSAWSEHEITAQIPADASSVVFGIFLAGHGRVELKAPRFLDAA